MKVQILYKRCNLWVLISQEVIKDVSIKVAPREGYQIYDLAKGDFLAFIKCAYFAIFFLDFLG